MDSRRKRSNTAVTRVEDSNHNEPNLPSSYTRDSIITILIGEEQTPFQLHQNLVCALSPYFLARMKQCWDGGQQDIDLPDVSVQGFEVVVDWMYSSALPQRAKVYEPGKNDPFQILNHAYKAADRLMMPKLQNALIDVFLTVMLENNMKPRLDYIRTLCRLEMTHTPYFEMVVMWVVQSMAMRPIASEQFSQSMEGMEEYPEALKTIVRYMNEYRIEPWSFDANTSRCRFHIHAKGDYVC